MFRRSLLSQDLVLAALLVSVIILMIIPLPQALVDIFIAINMSLAVLLLMVSIYLRHPSDFSTLPSVILIGTAFRLAISIATTRLILTDAEAGQIIATFGNFVIGGSLIVGLVIFFIITIVQFIVITKGAERVAEVAARFCLDSLPGKQMSIDAELRAGSIEAAEGAARRQKLDVDSQFFGAMDGAMKFVKGDAIASLIIVAVNLIGGIAVGMLAHGYAFGQAVQVYSLLTVGEGLVAQIPALFMSMSAATIITRVTRSEDIDLGTEITRQLGANQRALYAAAVVMLMLALIPGFPWAVFIALSAGTCLIAFMVGRSAQQAGAPAVEAEVADGAAADAQPIEAEPPQPIRETERHMLVMGSALYEQAMRDGLRDHRAVLYTQWNTSTGANFPGFAIARSDSLPPWSMRVDFDNVPAAQFDIPADSMLLVCDAELQAVLPVAATLTPQNWTGPVGCWVDAASVGEFPEIAAQCKPAGHAVAEAAFRIGERFAGQLFSRVELGYFFSVVEDKDPIMTRELAETLGIPGVQDILRRLIEDGVPLKPQRLIMETLHQWMSRTRDPVALVDAVRLAMRRQICHALADSKNVIACVVLEPAVEKGIRQSLQNTGGGSGVTDRGIVLEPRVSERLLQSFYTLQSSKIKVQRTLVVVTAPDIRRALRNFLSMNNIHFPVISFQELSPEVHAHPVTMIRLQDSKPAMRQAA